MNPGGDMDWEELLGSDYIPSSSSSDDFDDDDDGDYEDDDYKENDLEDEGHDESEDHVETQDGGESPMTFKFDESDSKVMQDYIEGKIPFDKVSEYLEREVVTDPTTADLYQSPQKSTPTKSGSAQSASNRSPYSSVIGRKGPRPPYGPRAVKLPADLQGMMGEATKNFVFKHFKVASDLCMAVIRRAPQCSESYHLLSEIHEQQNNMTRAVELGMIGAHLSSGDVEPWIRLADMATQHKMDSNLIIKCYRQALRTNSKRLPLEAYLNLAAAEKKVDPRKAIETLKRLCKHILDLQSTDQEVQSTDQEVQSMDQEVQSTDQEVQSTDQEVQSTDLNQMYIQTAMEVARLLHQLEKVSEACIFLGEAVAKFPKDISSDVVHLLCELLMDLKRYDDILILLRDHCGVQLVKTEVASDPSSSKYSECIVPERMPVDISAKLIISLIHEGYKELYKPLFETFFPSTSVNSLGDLHLDIAETFLECELYEDAKPILENLTQAELIMGPVWLRLGACLNALGDLPGAVAAYKTAWEEDPTSNNARVSLLLLHQQMGQEKEAMQVLTPEGLGSEGQADVKVYLNRCHTLYEEKNFDDYVKVVWHLLFGHLPPGLVQHFDPAVTYSYPRKCFTISRDRDRRRCMRKAFIFPEDNPPDTKLVWDLFLKMMYVLEDKKDYTRAVKGCLLALAIPEFYQDCEKVKELAVMCTIAYSRSNQKGNRVVVDMVRTIIFGEIDNKNYISNTMINHLSKCINVAPDHKQTMYLMDKALRTNPHLDGFRLLKCHQNMKHGTYSRAFAGYQTMHNNRPEDPMLRLLMGVALIQITSSPYCLKPSSLLLQACSHLQAYLRLRGNCQEAYYNLGRAMHSVTLLPAAIHFYEKALEVGPPEVVKSPKPHSDDISGYRQGELDLTREIAYNLTLIYKETGSMALVQHIYEKYLVI